MMPFDPRRVARRGGRKEGRKEGIFWHHIHISSSSSSSSAAAIDWAHACFASCRETREGKTKTRVEFSQCLRR